jgi:hypothetical protein
MGRKKITVENVYTRKVLVEKVCKNQELHSYIAPNMRAKNPFKNVEKQIANAKLIVEHNKLKFTEHLESYFFFDKTKLLNRVLILLLKKAIRGEVKHVFLSDLKLLCPADKIVQLYVLQAFFIGGATIYRSDGTTIDYFDCREMAWFSEYEYFLKVVTEVEILEYQDIMNLREMN